MMLFIGELLFYTWCRVQCTRTGYEISQATERHAALLALQNKLKIELARLKSPERLERIAKEQLGLGSPKAGQIVQLP